MPFYLIFCKLHDGIPGHQILEDAGKFLVKILTLDGKKPCRYLLAQNEQSGMRNFEKFPDLRKFCTGSCRFRSFYFKSCVRYTCETRKNVSYFISKALFVLDIIKF